MYLHITFTNGSNPYVAYGDESKIKKELKKWKRNYDLYIDKTPSGDYLATAYDKLD